MDQDPQRILTTLDNPMRIVFFTPLEFMAIFIPVCIGAIVGGGVGFVLAMMGFFIRKYLVRLQRRYSAQHIQGWLYWQFPFIGSNRDVRLPFSHIREYVA